MTNAKELRRVILDGVAIVTPYRNVLQSSHRKLDGEMDSPVIAKEIEYLNNWLRRARAVAINLGMKHPGKSGAKDG